jgi:hypothetical protein
MIQLQFGKAILCFQNKNKEKNEADSVYYQRWPFGKKYEVKLGGNPNKYKLWKKFTRYSFSPSSLHGPSFSLPSSF